MDCLCRRCDRTYEYNRKKGHKKTLCNSCNVAVARHRLKVRAVEYMGGSCTLCSYDFCPAALAFHHLESEEKDFNIAAGGRYRSWARVKKELEKCVLVCNNCHAEVHSGLKTV